MVLHLGLRIRLCLEGKRGERIEAIAANLARAAHGYGTTREAAMAAFAKSWRQ